MRDISSASWPDRFALNASIAAGLLTGLAAARCDRAFGEDETPPAVVSEPRSDMGRGSTPPAHHPDAEGVAADALARHVPTTKPRSRATSRSSRKAAGNRCRTATSCVSRAQHRGAAARQRLESLRRSRPSANRKRRVRLIRRVRGEAFPGAPRYLAGWGGRGRSPSGAEHPAISALNQLRSNLTPAARFDSKGATRFVVCNIPAAQLEAIENGTGDVAAHCGGRQAGPAVARD